MKKYLIVLLLLFEFNFSYTQVNPTDSTIVFNLWSVWNPTFFQNQYLTMPFVYDTTIHVCAGTTAWLNGRLISIGGSNLILTGIIPSYIGNLTELNIIYLADNPNLGGIIPPELGNLTKLEKLILTNCNFNSTIPPQIGNLSNLTDLMIGNPGVVGTIPNTFLNLNKLERIELRNSDLVGPLPGCFGVIDSLYALGMVFNYNFVSILPDSLCLAPNLIQLVIPHNAFYGTIPACLGNTKITEMDISYNNFSGAVPKSLFPEFGGHVQTFKADHNQLTSFPLIHNNYPDNIYVQDLSYNKFQFGDFEEIYLYGYMGGIDGLAPQDSVWSVLDTTVLKNTTVTLNSTVTGQYNMYHWYKNGVNIGSSYNGLWIIPNIQLSDSGTYTCDITNLYVTPWKGLTLNRQPIYLHVVNGSGITEQIGNANIVEVYPNPCNNNITVKFKQMGLEPVNITVLDSKGKTILQTITTEYENNFNTEKLAKGLYLVKVETEQKVLLTKFTKE